MPDVIKKKTQISLKEMLNSIIPENTEENVFYLQVVIAIIIGLVTLALIWKLFRRSSKRGAVLLMGLCESGKTQLFSQLCYGWRSLPVTSIKPSMAPYKNGKKEVTVYDLPGHERIRYSVFEKVKTQAKGIMFIIDSATIQKDIRDAAEFLYTILCDGSIQNGLSSLLIVCNKQDLPLAKAKTLIQTTLEKEMNNLRVTQANQLQSVGSGSSNINFLGKKGTHFEFSHLSPMKVEFIESAANEKEQLDGVKSWLNNMI